MAEVSVHVASVRDIKPIASLVGSLPPDYSPDASPYDPLDERLGRLLKKGGVRATLVLDRATGTVLKTSGDISSLQTNGASSTPIPVTTPPVKLALPSADSNNIGGEDGGNRGLEHYARLIWRFVRASVDVLQEVDVEDEVKLLRLRTKKQELVVVPDSRYLLVVVHDTPAA